MRTKCVATVKKSCPANERHYVWQDVSADLTIRIKRGPAVWQALIKTDQNLTYLKCQISEL